MSWTRLLMLLAIQVTVASGCSILERSDEPETGPSIEVPATIEVTNMYWAAVNVYVLNRGTAVRLGTLTTNQTERFGLPNSFGESPEVAFLVDPIGSRARYTTPSVLAGPGQEVVLRIENNLDLSSLLVR